MSTLTLSSFPTLSNLALAPFDSFREREILVIQDGLKSESEIAEYSLPEHMDEEARCLHLMQRGKDIQKYSALDSLCPLLFHVDSQAKGDSVFNKIMSDLGNMICTWSLDLMSYSANVYTNMIRQQLQHIDMRAKQLSHHHILNYDEIEKFYFVLSAQQLGELLATIMVMVDMEGSSGREQNALTWLAPLEEIIKLKNSFSTDNNNNSSNNNVMSDDVEQSHQLLHSNSVIDIEVLYDKLIPFCLNKGELTSNMNCKVLSLKLIGLLFPLFKHHASHSNTHNNLEKLLQHFYMMCNDNTNNIDIKIICCHNIHTCLSSLSSSLSSSHVNKLFHELENFLSHDATELRIVAYETIVNCYEYMSESIRKQRIIPLFKYYCNNIPKYLLVCFIENYGKMLYVMQNDVESMSNNNSSNNNMNSSNNSNSNNNNSLNMNSSMNSIISNNHITDSSYNMKYFLSFYKTFMTNYSTNSAQDVTIRTLMAYNYPAILKMTPLSRYHTELHPIFLKLTNDNSVDIKKKMASSLHVVIELLGDMCVKYTKDVLIAYLYCKDRSYVEITEEIMKHLERIVELYMLYKGDEPIAPLVSEMMRSLILYENNLGLNWRKKLEFFTYSLSFPKLFSLDLVNLHTQFIPLLFDNLHKSPLPVQLICIDSLSHFLRTFPYAYRRQELWLRIYKEFGCGKSYQSRMIFLEIVKNFLYKFSYRWFKKHIFASFLSLHNDPVRNVRRKFCTLLPLLKWILKTPADNMLVEQLRGVVEKMTQDNDRHVRELVDDIYKHFDRIDINTEFDRLNRKKELEEDDLDRMEEDLTDKKPYSGTSVVTKKKEKKRNQSVITSPTSSSNSSSSSSSSLSSSSASSTTPLPQSSPTARRVSTFKSKLSDSPPTTPIDQPTPLRRNSSFTSSSSSLVSPSSQFRKQPKSSRPRAISTFEQHASAQILEEELPEDEPHSARVPGSAANLKGRRAVAASATATSGSSSATNLNSATNNNAAGDIVPSYTPTILKTNSGKVMRRPSQLNINTNSSSNSISTLPSSNSASASSSSLNNNASPSPPSSFSASPPSATTPNNISSPLSSSIASPSSLNASSYKSPTRLIKDQLKRSNSVGEPVAATNISNITNINNNNGNKDSPSKDQPAVDEGKDSSASTHTSSAYSTANSTTTTSLTPLLSRRFAHSTTINVSNRNNININGTSNINSNASSSNNNNSSPGQQQSLHATPPLTSPTTSSSPLTSTLAPSINSSITSPASRYEREEKLVLPKLDLSIAERQNNNNSSSSINNSFPNANNNTPHQLASLAPTSPPVFTHSLSHSSSPPASFPPNASPHLRTIALLSPRVQRMNLLETRVSASNALPAAVGGGSTSSPRAVANFTPSSNATNYNNSKRANIMINSNSTSNTPPQSSPTNQHQHHTPPSSTLLSPLNHKSTFNR